MHNKESTPQLLILWHVVSLNLSNRNYASQQKRAVGFWPLKLDWRCHEKKAAGVEKQGASKIQTSEWFLFFPYHRDNNLDVRRQKTSKPQSPLLSGFGEHVVPLVAV